MRKFRAIYWLLSCILLITVVGSLWASPVVLAVEKGSDSTLSLPLNQQQPSSEGSLAVICVYPVLEGISGDSFSFQVDFKWSGSGYRRFDLSVTGFPDWVVSIISSTSKPIAAIGLDPTAVFPETVTIIMAPLYFDKLPEPGAYVITLEASSGDIKETIELTAVVTAKYLYAFYTADERVSAEVTAGQENHLALKVANTGTAVIDKITFNSEKPTEWVITFKPDTITSLEPGFTQEVDMVIKPPRNTITGDYMITLSTLGGLSSPQIELRITVLTPLTGLWVGIVVVLVVIVAVAMIFRRLGRR